jgi:hypothetical protein
MEDSLYVLGGIVLGVAIFSLAKLARGTQQKNDWGINLGAPKCAQCKAALPQVRTPTSMRQAMWGGWTCGNCGAELDKWGRIIGSPTQGDDNPNR